MSEPMPSYCVDTQQNGIITTNDRSLLQQMYRHLEMSNRANIRMMRTIERLMQELEGQE